jgi:HAD superfamily hydrolase (TIGR01450 family)
MFDETIAAALKPIRCFLLDMDGTIYLGERLLAGSLDFLEAVRRSGREVLFLTNNSSRSSAHYVEKLGRLGIAAHADVVLSSGWATGRYLLREHPGKRIFLLGNESLRAEMEGMGIVIDETHPDLVLIGYDTTLTYQKMVKVCDFVRAGLPYVATHPDFTCPVDGGFEPDIGAIAAFIHAATGRTPDITIGKPYGEIVRAATDRTGCTPDALAMCGDRLYTDIKTGVDHGITSVLVFTGETTREDLAASDLKPTIAVERLADLVAYL